MGGQGIVSVTYQAMSYLSVCIIICKKIVFSRCVDLVNVDINSKILQFWMLRLMNVKFKSYSDRC